MFDRAGFERRAPFFHVYREANRRRIVPFHHLLASGMKFADELVEGEACHRAAAFFLGGDELVEHLTEVSLFAFLARARFLEKLLVDVCDLRRLLCIAKAIIV